MSAQLAYNMKYIFRYTLLSQFTANPDNLTAQDLLQSLKKVNFPQLAKIEALVDTSRTAIDALVKNMARSSSEMTKQIITQCFGSDYESSVDEMVQVWENEKQLIVSRMLTDSCRSQWKLSQIGWQINSGIGSRTELQKDKSAILSLYSTNAAKQTSKTTIELTKKQLSQAASILTSAAEFLSLNLK